MDKEKTLIRPDGLRYRTKSSGTSFAGGSASSMSCLLCGRHRPRQELRAFKLAGATQYRCNPAC